MRTVERRNKMKYDIRLDKKGNNQKKNHLNTSKLCHTDKLIDFYLSVWFDYAFLWAQHSIRFVRIRRRKAFDSRNIKTEKKTKEIVFLLIFLGLYPFVPVFVHCCCVCVCERARALLLCFLSHIIDLKSKKEKERESKINGFDRFSFYFLLFQSSNLFFRCALCNSNYLV